MQSRTRNISNFKQRVLNVVAQIPKGETRTYKDVAVMAGSPNAYRAVGNIMNRNRNLKVPCHRVIKSDLPAPRPGKFFVYAILCKNDAIYIGQTRDLQKRWRQHQDGTAADYTKRFGVAKLIHYEIYNSQDRALKREKDLKTGFGRKWLKREWKAGRTRQAGGTVGGYALGGSKKKKEILRREGAL